MQTLALVTGYCGLLLACLALCGFVYGWLWLLYSHLSEKRANTARKEAILQIAGRMVQDSHWFSEDVPTAWLMQKLANDLITHQFSDVSAVRETWRKARDQQKIRALEELNSYCKVIDCKCYSHALRGVRYYSGDSVTKNDN